MKADGSVPPKILRAISGPNNAAFSVKLLAWTTCLAAGLWAAQALEGLAALVVGGTLIAIGLSYGAELVHQMLHGSALRGRALNRWVGFIVGIPMLLSFSQYKDIHLNHHATLGTPDDDELFKGTTARGSALQHLSLDRYVRLTADVTAAWASPSSLCVVNSKYRTDVVGELRAISLMWIAFALIGSAFGLNCLAIAGGLWLSGLISALVAKPEHWRCDEVRDVFCNTRTIKTSWLVSLILNGNNFHVEHHLHPRVRPERLSTVHLYISDRLVNVDESYWEFVCHELSMTRQSKLASHRTGQR